VAEAWFSDGRMRYSMSMSCSDKKPPSRREVCVGAAAAVAATAVTGGRRAAAACGGPLVAGPASQFAQGTGTVFVAPQVVVCRDAQGLYAMSAKCPHTGCTFTFQNSQMFCPCHSAIYDLNGNYVSGPANSPTPPPLPHLPLSIDSGGNVIVDYTATTDQNSRTQ
jgi:cytochrome b6-f complex iron-sulfur subunit